MKKGSDLMTFNRVGACRAPVLLLLGLLVAGIFTVPTVCLGETFRDALGRELTLTAPPQRIVSLAPSLTESLYALGLGERVVGVTRFSTYPPDAAGKPRVGSYDDLNVERIISLGPDLVIGTKDGNQPDVVRLLEEAGIRVFLVDPRDVGQIIASVATLGLVCGVPEKGRALAEDLEGRVNRVLEVTASRKRPLVFLQINIRPIMSVSSRTYHHDLIRLAGGVNMTRDAGMIYPRLSREAVLAGAPEVLIISCMERGGRFEAARREWLTWQSIPAARDNRVHLIDSDLIDRPSPRVVTALETMARLIHPDAPWDHRAGGR